MMTCWKEKGERVCSRKVVLLGDSLSSEMLLDSDGVVCASLDCTVVCDNNAIDALDDTNTGNDTSSRDICFRVQFMAGQRAELEERSTGIDQGSDAVTRQHLLPSKMLLPGLVGTSLLHSEGELLQAAHGVAHRGMVIEVLWRRRIDRCGKAGDSCGVMRRRERRGGATLHAVAD